MPTIEIDSPTSYKLEGRSSDETTSKWQVLKKKEGKGKDEKLNKRESFDDSWRTDRRARWLAEWNRTTRANKPASSDHFGAIGGGRARTISTDSTGGTSRGSRIAAVLLRYSVEREGSIGGGTSHGRDHGPLSSSATFVRIYHRLSLHIFRETVHLPSFFYFYLILFPFLSSLSRKPLPKYKRASLRYWRKRTNENISR